MCFQKLFLIAVAVAAGLASAASAAETNSADRAWQALTNLTLSPPPAEWTIKPPTEADIMRFDDRRAIEAGAIADKAQAFYTAFPKDPKTPVSRILEIQALQASVHLGATNRVKDLIAREEMIVRDTNAPADFRYQMRMDLIGREFKEKVDAGADPRAEMEKAGRTLVKEFPTGPAGYQILVDLLETVDLAKMQEIANVITNSGGPPAVTDLGKGVLRRLALVGKPFPIEFKTIDGKQVDRTTLSNKVVLVDFWAVWCPVCVQETPEIKKLYDRYHEHGFEVVGINFDDQTNVAQQFVKDQGLPWPQYYGGNLDNRYGHEYGISVFPQSWLIDRKGIVQDIHGRLDREAKIEKLMAR